MIRRLLAQALSAGVKVYLVGRSGSRITGLADLAPASSKSTAVFAIDDGNALKKAYQPSGLEILLVDSRGVVKVKSNLQPGFQMEQTLRQLKPAR